MTESLVISYTADESVTSYIYDSPFLKLIQEQADNVDNNPSDNDLIAMYNYIVAGMSAHEYTNDNCPVSFTSEGIQLTLGVNVNLNPIDLEYEIYSSRGNLIGPSLYLGEEEKLVIIPMSDELDFGYIIDDLQISWETPCYNSNGESIIMPDFEVVGTKIVFPEPIFRVGWGAVKYRCHKYDVPIISYYDTVTEYTDAYGRSITQEEAIRTGRVSYIIANFSTTITAKYLDQSGEEVVETLSLDIPDCVNSFLNVCLTQDSEGNTETEIPEDNLSKAKVYYDTCDGKTLLVEEPK